MSTFLLIGAHFTMPNSCTDSTVTPGTVYSYDYGLAHFVVLNTENVTGYEAQKAVLKKDISKTVDFSIVPQARKVNLNKTKATLKAGKTTKLLQRQTVRKLRA